MPETEKRVPELRFEGFVDDWEQRKLEEDISVVGGATPSKSNPEYWNGSIVWLSSQEIKEKYVSKGTYTITKKAVDDNTTKMVKAGTPLIVSRSGILARLFPISIPTTDVAINQDIKALIFDPNIINTNFFVAQLQKNEDFILRSIVKTGTTVQSINMPDFYKLQLSFPSTDEQEKVGKFFQRLDDTIALHQRKLTLLQRLKQTYMQGMFPQNWEHIPSLRFADFSEPWEQRKVGEYLKESRIPGTDGSVARKLTVKLWRKGVIPKEESYQGSTATNYFVRKSGQFIYGKLDFLNQAFGIVPHHLDGYESTLDSPAFDILPTLNSNFFLEYISREQFYLYQGTLANGSRKAKRIHTETFFEMPINVPSSEEQNKIGNFLKQFDDAIDLHQQKIDNMQSLKSTLLNKMFI